MNPAFKPPLTEEEFQKRAATTTLFGAKNVLATLKKQRDDEIRRRNVEISFYERVVKFKEQQANAK